MPNENKVEGSSDEEIQSSEEEIVQEVSEDILEESDEPVEAIETEFVETIRLDPDEVEAVSVAEEIDNVSTELGDEPVEDELDPKETIKLEEQPGIVDVSVEESEFQPSEPPIPPVPPQVSPPAPLSPADERTWAMLAHLSILLNLVTGFLGPLAALGIYLFYKDRSRYVAYQSMQSFVFQLIWWVGAGVVAGLAWLISGLLTVVIIGCCVMPIALAITLIPLAALVYGVVGAIETNQGKDFKYWLIGDWVRSTYTGN